MIIRFYQGWFQMLYIDLPLFMASTFSISSFYRVSQKELFPRSWPRALLYLPFLMALGIGLTITNTKAVIEALIGKESAFARTPKYSVVSNKIKSAPPNIASVWDGCPAGTCYRLLLRGHRLLRRRQRKRHYHPFPAAVRRGLLVHRIDVAPARPLRQALHESHHPHQTLSGWRLASYKFSQKL